jgi:D-alanine-D-alanine ligase
MIDTVSRGGIALLYQALPPPMIGGLRKDAKPGGYSDGGASTGNPLRTFPAGGKY